MAHRSGGADHRQRLGVTLDDHIFPGLDTPQDAGDISDSIGFAYVQHSRLQLHNHTGSST